MRMKHPPNAFGETGHESAHRCPAQPPPGGGQPMGGGQQVIQGTQLAVYLIAKRGQPARQNSF